MGEAGEPGSSGKVLFPGNTKFEAEKGDRGLPGKNT
jgi:hypothetical protein